ncbi:MAG: CmpA/NrtA family ABC transporter substrate-binding protein [Pseudanabaena sp. ELA607]
MSISSNRRQFLLALGAWGTVQTLQGCGTTPPVSLSPTPPLPVQPAWDAIQQPEVTQARLGYLPTAAAAPIIVAQHLKFFARYGMNEVQLLPFASWVDWITAVVAGRDDKLADVDGAIEGGHSFSPLPELLTEGLLAINGTKKLPDLEIAIDNTNPDVSRQGKLPMYVLARLHTHGGAIVMHPRYRPLMNMGQQRPWRPTFQLSRFLGNVLRCGVVSALSPEMLWLRYWLASGNLNPLQDVRLETTSFQSLAKIFTEQQPDLISVPPLFLGLANNYGSVQMTSANLWPSHPGDLFTLRADWVDRYPNATQGLLYGILAAQNWCDAPQNSRQLHKILQMYLPTYRQENLKNSDPKPSSEPRSSASNQSNSQPNNQSNNKIDINKTAINAGGIKYWSHEGKTVSYPYKSHDLWFLLEHSRWSHLPQDLEYKPIIDMVNREDLWRSAARNLGIPDTLMPSGISRGKEQFFDGMVFDPEQPKSYQGQESR